MKTNLGTSLGICLVICFEIKICAITGKGTLWAPVNACGHLGTLELDLCGIQSCRKKYENFKHFSKYCSYFKHI